jgi:hypothetical protein
MPTREYELEELASILSAAIEKARQLSLPTTAYILSMALVEVSQALTEIAEDEDDGANN